MKYPFQYSLVIDSVAAFIKQYFGANAPIYDNPSQQAVKLPCWTIQFTGNASIKREIGNSYRVELGIDIVYESAFNAPTVVTEYRNAAQIIDENLLYLYYKYTVTTNGTSQTYTVPMQVKDREWEADRDSLHYKFWIRPRVYIAPEDVDKMQTLDLTETVTDQ